MCALSALVGVVFDFSTILAALSLVVFAVYDITAIFAAMERHPADSAADWAMALRAAQQERGRGLMVNTLMVSAVLLSITVGAYHSDMTALTAFSFPLTTGLAFALYAGLVLTPLLWYEFRFGRDSGWNRTPLNSLSETDLPLGVCFLLPWIYSVCWK